jgi:uncharacterized protein
MENDSGLANGDSQSYWDEAGAGHLVFQQCRTCEAVQFPPRHQCATCWSEDLCPVESGGRGIIESLTVVRRAPLARFRAQVPYVVSAIRVSEGPRMITNLVGEGALSASIGDEVAVTFEPDEEGRILPQFRLA